MSDFVPVYSASHALIIGINSYADPRFVPLGEAENDARQVADLLGSAPFGFTVNLLLGQAATRQHILDALYDLRSARPDARVLVYFAGHGYTETDKFGDETGYLAAVDTIHNRNSSALKLSDITDFRRHTDALHVGFVFDACFSGQALGITRAPAEVQPDRRRAFQVISAGAGDQAVSDYHSMTDAMLEALRGDAHDASSILTFNSLGLYLQQTIAARSGRLQIPQFGSLTGHQGDDLVLYVDSTQRLPGDLEIALRAENPFVRGGAVSGLIDVARSDDPEMSKLAVEWLSKLAADDPDERVRGAAQAYFDEQDQDPARPSGAQAPPAAAPHSDTATTDRPRPAGDQAVSRPPIPHAEKGRIQPAPVRKKPSSAAQTRSARPAARSDRTSGWLWLPVVGILIIIFGVVLSSMGGSGGLFGPPPEPTDTPTPTPVPASQLPGALLRLEGNGGGVYALDFSPDGQILASGMSRAIVLWDGSDWSEIDRFDSVSGATDAVEFSPDGQTLASGSSDKLVFLWDVATGDELAQLEAHGGSVNDVTFSPDGTMLVSAGWDEQVIIWDVETRQEITRLTSEYDTTVEGLAFTPDGETLVTGAWDNYIVLWRVDGWVPYAALSIEEGQVLAVDFSPEGRFVAAGSGGIGVWHVETEFGLFSENVSGLIYSLAFSPDGSILAAGNSDGSISLRDGATFDEIARLEGHSDDVESLAFSPDGDVLASGSRDSTILIWDLTQILSD